MIRSKPSSRCVALGVQYESLALPAQSRRKISGRCDGPKTPGRTESSSVRHRQVEPAVVPSRPGSPASWNSTRPLGVMHCWAISSGTLGTTEWSAYTTRPRRSAAVVLTHGIPPCWSWRRTRSWTPVARPMSRKVSMVRSCSPLASRIAQTLAGVHGISVSGASAT